MTKTEAKEQRLKKFTGIPCVKCGATERYASNGDCAACAGARARNYEKANPDKVRAIHTAYRRTHPEKERAYQAKYRKSHPERVRAADIVRTTKWQKANPERTRAMNIAYRKANPDKVREWQAKDRKANAEKRRAAALAYYWANPELRRAKVREYNAANPDKIRDRAAVYRKANPEKMRALSASKRAARAHPLWIKDNADIKREIEDIYADCPGGCHVDHVVPLKGKDASGTHVVSGLHVPWNLQYLPAKQNMSKHCRFEPLHQAAGQ